jgi:hypothetical protein
MLNDGRHGRLSGALLLFIKGELATMAKKLAEETEKAITEAEEAAKSSGTLNPALAPDKIKTPIPGTTPDLDVVTTDEATSLNPNVVVSGTKPDGEGGQVLLDVVDPAVANAGILGPKTAIKPENPSLPPEDTSRQPGEGEVLFEVTADNEPFWGGHGLNQGGPLKKGQKVVMSKEEAELLTQTKAGNIVSSSAASSEPAPAPKASSRNAKPEGSEAE